MKIFITGGTGFVGTHLSNYFLNKGDTVLATGTSARQNGIDHPEFTYISSDTTVHGKWQEYVKQADVVINLAGRSILKRWTKSYKKEIYDSRILTTRHLVEALPRDKAVVLFSTSAVGYYGSRGDALITENESSADDFLGRIGRDWEREALVAKESNHRVVLMRFGVVLGRGGGAFKQMAAVFMRFTGGPIGDGRQWFPWIHIQDVAGAIDFISKNKRLDAAFNFCSPHPLRNREVARSFGRALRRPAILPAPALMLRLILGEFAETLLASQRVVPDRLMKEGFEFRFPTMDEALADLV